MAKPPRVFRRKYPRVRTEALVLVQGADPKLARGVDLGIGGIRFQCVGLDLEIGEVIEATLVLGDDSVKVVGKTVRVTDMGRTQEVALAFERVVDPEVLERLCELELSGDREKSQA